MAPLQRVTYYRYICREDAVKAKRARVIWTGRNQAVRLPKELHFATDTGLVHREGNAVIVEPANEWPAGYVESFAGIPDDFARPPQGKVERTSLG
jgi:virulence-associated protein VagC